MGKSIIHVQDERVNKMNYKGYSLEERDNCLKIRNIKDFSLTHIFECGQCFRWVRQQDGSFKGIVKGKTVTVSFDGETLSMENSTVEDFIDIWFNYFDLGTDYSKIKSLLEKDETMHEAIKTGYGIRLLRQDFWEMLISFIISANNMIPRIMKIVETLSVMKGECIDRENSVFSFPAAEAIAASTLEDIQQCRAGFRCKYIHQTSQLIANGNITRDKLLNMTTEEARKELVALPGVGPKVADCILLFSGIKYDVFPTDVWVKRVMEELYIKKEASLKDIQQYARDRFGDLSGYAQQYLFYHARLNKIGTNSKKK